jgi:hypothetical protein
MRPPTPTVIDAIRLNIGTAERALAAGDARTLSRCIDAAERLFVGLRALCEARGLSLGGTPIARDPEDERRAAWNDYLDSLP